MNKKNIRKQFMEKRDNLTKTEVEKKSNHITTKLLDLELYKNSSFIMSYVNFKNEVKTEKLIKHSINIQKKIGVPITIPQTRELIVSELKNFDQELVPGTYNIPTPKKECIRKIDPTLIDLIIVPAVAFDKEGYRIGYGGGYYDKFLSTINKEAIKLGLAYDFQLVDKISHELHDIPMDYILTEKQLIACKTKKF